MNSLLTDAECRRRDEEFDRYDAARHRSKCIPAYMCCLTANGPVYCSVHDPEPWLYRVQLSDEIVPFKSFDEASAWADQAHLYGRHVVSIYRADLAEPIPARTDAEVRAWMRGAR